MTTPLAARGSSGFFQIAKATPIRVKQLFSLLCPLYCLLGALAFLLGALAFLLGPLSWGRYYLTRRGQPAQPSLTYPDIESRYHRIDLLVRIRLHLLIACALEMIPKEFLAERIIQVILLGAKHTLVEHLFFALVHLLGTIGQ